MTVKLTLEATCDQCGKVKVVNKEFKHNQQLTLLVQEANSYRQMTAVEFNAEAFYFDGAASQ